MPRSGGLSVSLNWSWYWVIWPVGLRPGSPVCNQRFDCLFTVDTCRTTRGRGRLQLGATLKQGMWHATVRWPECQSQLVLILGYLACGPEAWVTSLQPRVWLFTYMPLEGLVLSLCPRASFRDGLNQCSTKFSYAFYNKWHFSEMKKHPHQSIQKLSPVDLSQI